jgi:hypothetical protein
VSSIHENPTSSWSVPHQESFVTFSHNASTGEYDIYSTVSRSLLISGTTEDTTLPRKIEEAIRRAEKIAYKDALDDAKRAINNI